MPRTIADELGLTAHQFERLTKYAMTLSPSHYEDYLQEAAIRAILKGPEAKFGYIIHCVRSIHIDRVRSSHFKNTLYGVEARVDVIDEVSEEPDNIEDVLVKLTPDEAVILRAKMNGIKYAEMSDLSGVPDRVVRTIVRHIKDKCNEVYSRQSNED